MPTRLAHYPRHANSLTFLRFLLATLVIVSHSWPLTGRGDGPLLGSAHLGTWVVAGSFALSGWLITQSRLNATLVQFTWRRFVRIYPGFVVALAVVAFGFAPLGASLGGGTYSLGDGVAHIQANFLIKMHVYSVGDSLREVPFPDAWNGSLWTLYFEVLCYATLAVLGIFVRRSALGSVMVCGLIAVTALHLWAPAVVRSTYDLGVFLELSPFFFAGSVLYLFRQCIPLARPAGLAALALLGVVVALHLDLVWGALPIAYFLLWVGAVLPFSRLGAHDLSYGVYIYAFPVQQTLSVLGMHRLPIGVYVLVSVACTIPLAALSLFVVERSAQRLRGLVDRRVGAKRASRDTAIAPAASATSG